MSCSHLIDSFTNAKYLYRGVSRFRQTFVCGECATCIKKQRTDWRVRSYYEAQNCLKDKRNFVLFDTLTYCDDHIKTYLDIFPQMDIPDFLNKSCFSREDVQKFFKRLRISLKRAGYRFASKELRYILSSEYGSDEVVNGFQRTHRPHYHILFFVSFSISPLEFSRFVSRAWYLGKTDGVRPYEDCAECPLKKYCQGKCLYQTSDYVLNERLVRNGSVKNVIKCVNYVTKYVSKDMYLSANLARDVETLWRLVYPGYQDDVLLYRQYVRFRSQVLPFHLQSQGFGLSLLADADEREYLIRTNQVHLPTGDRSVVVSVALPRYYQRKLYYDYEKVDGRVHWFLTDCGVDAKLRQLDDKIKSFIHDYRAYDDKISDSKLFDLALYKLVYRGTLTDYQSLMLPYRQYYRRMIQRHPVDETPLYYNYNTKRDKMTIGSFLSTRYVITEDGEIIYKGKQLHKEFLPYDGYVVVNDKVCSYWYGFDRKLVAYDRWRKSIAVSNDVMQYQKDVDVDYYKQLGLLRSK